MHRQAEHRAAQRRDRAIGVDGVQVGEQLAGLGERPGRGSVDEAEFVPAAPGGEFQRERREVGLNDLGRSVSRAGAVFELAPEPVGSAGLRSPGAPGALFCRGAAGRHGGEPGHPGACVEARLAGEPAVDHHAHTVDRQRGLGDVGGQHDAAPPRLRRCERRVLFGQGEGAGEREHVDIAGDNVAEHRLGPADLSDPRQEHEDVAALFAQRPLHGGDDVGLDAMAAARGPLAATRPPPPHLGRRSGLRTGPGHPVHVDVEHAALARHDGGIEQRRQPLDVGCRRHRQQSEIRPDRRGDVEREREAEIGGQVALVDLVEDDQADAGELRVVLEATGEHALGEHLDPGRSTDVALVACLVADEAADLGARGCGHPACRGTGGQAAGLQHHDPPTVEPRLVEQGQRDDGRLAGSRWCDEHGASTLGQRLTYVGDRLDDGEVGNLDRPRGHGVSPARANRGTDPGRRGRARGSRSTSRPRRWRRRRSPIRAGSTPAPRRRRHHRRG